MASVLLHTGDESVTLPPQAVKRLLERGDGDAALLYLALLRHHGMVTPRSLEGELRWERSRIEAAEEVLQTLRLIAPSAETVIEPAEEAPHYRHADILQQLEENPEFRGLTVEVERKLGKKLTTPELSILLGLLDHLGLPADVIYLLLCHCDERIQQRYGEGRHVTLPQLQKEGYIWKRYEIYTQKAATEYLKRYAERRNTVARYMRVLRLGNRAPVESEEKYLLAWEEMGFPPETLAIAYDKTVLKCHELRWGYCDAIMKRWHKAGLHTPEEVKAGEYSTAKQGTTPDSAVDDAWNYV